MVHKECGTFNPNAPCMDVHKVTKNKICTKHYPQPFRDRLQLSENGRAEYKRLNNGDAAMISEMNGENKVGNKDIDNTWVVLYNPYLLMKYDAHICVDVVSVFFFTISCRLSLQVRSQRTRHGKGEDIA